MNSATPEVDRACAGRTAGRISRLALPVWGRFWSVYNRQLGLCGKMLTFRIITTEAHGIPRKVKRAPLVIMDEQQENSENPRRVHNSLQECIAFLLV